MEENSKSQTFVDLETIINGLDHPQRGFPWEAIEQARERSQEITPRLIRLIQDATDACRKGNLGASYGHFYASFLLTEFRAVEAWPAIREAISLPDDMPYELFGDAITEDFGCIIATVTGEDIDSLDELVSDQSLDEYVRGAACDAILYRVRDGVLSRGDAIEWLSAHLEKAIENKDEVTQGLVLRLEDLAAEHKLPLIEKAFDADLVEEDYCPLEEIRYSIAKGDETIKTTMERLLYPESLIDHLQRWSDHGQDGSSSELDDYDLDLDGDDDDPFVAYDLIDSYEEDDFVENDTTIRNEVTKIGRNDKCSCGSGKKYKRCCGNR